MSFMEKTEELCLVQTHNTRLAVNKNNLCDTCQGKVILDRQDINEIENAKYSRAQFDEHTYSEIDREFFRDSSIEISESEIVNRLEKLKIQENFLTDGEKAVISNTPVTVRRCRSLPGLPEGEYLQPRELDREHRERPRLVG